MLDNLREVFAYFNKHFSWRGDLMENVNIRQAGKFCWRYGLPWLLLPLTTMGLLYIINPWLLVCCALVNPFFELLVDTFQIFFRSDAVLRCIFGALFVYVHALLPTVLYYFERNKKMFLIALLIWGIMAGSTVLNALLLYFFEIKLG